MHLTVHADESCIPYWPHGTKALHQNSNLTDLKARLIEADLIHDAAATLQPLTGGISSEIYLVSERDKHFVVKRALSQLKVADDWFADPVRNQYEQAFIREVGAILPDAVPKIYYGADQFFTMEFFDERYQNWKTLLLSKTFEPETFESAARLLATIHRQTAGKSRLHKQFDNTDNFYDLRIESYLIQTARRHPNLATIIEAEAKRLAACRECLVHGDFSPKNILVSPERLVLIDSEVAWYGDPAFDLAFVLNHFLLKTLYHAPAGTPLESLITDFHQLYFDIRDLDTPSHNDLDCRTAHLLTMLLLARVDGKSPVEYLTEHGKGDFVRTFSTARIPGQPLMLAELIQQWFHELKRLS